MKKIVLLFLVMMSLTIKAQESKVNLSKSTTVELLQKDGILLKKDFFTLGKVAGVDFENIIITNLSTGKKTGALRIKTYYYTANYNKETYIGTLDSDELDSCIKSLQYIKGNAANGLPDNDVEYIFKTKDDVTLGTFISTNKQNERFWEVFIKTTYSLHSERHIDLKNLDSIINLFQLSAANLKEHL